LIQNNLIKVFLNINENEQEDKSDEEYQEEQDKIGCSKSRSAKRSVLIRISQYSP